ncbi:GntR family transcriptional regulator [Streptomyces caatingaensis]|uniref:GntR family transcriptional regulator n=1 Tax=Streptomyces caatingaensis TaxID=1678637 RepID=A0A0K9X886_9ACTN|nr:GntR family transcriptional regulator [Streptomyces caatingaensis]KNB49644.1 GntR family transcriptional regulator [Streptomyces caatingaensis]
MNGGEGAGASDRRPLHQRIAADLRDEIMSGTLPADGRVPSTQRLKDRFCASNATVQKALQALKAEGLVVGRPGAAVTVRPHRQRTAPAGAYADPDAGGRSRARLLEVAEVAAPADVAAALNLARDEPVLMRSRLLLSDGEPAELVKSFYPLDIARGTAIAERGRIPGGTPALLAELGHPPRRWVDRVAARVPTQEQFSALELPGDLPVLRTFRVVYSDHERPVEVTVAAKAGHLHEVCCEFEGEG